MRKRVFVESVAEAYLELLASRGVDYLFGNAGTDFAPLIEAYAKRQAQGQMLPSPLTVPHEIPAVAMAHGYAMVTGRAQAVMVHVVVGTANGLGGVINAARTNVPMLFTAGRTPITEGARPGARDRHIHWAQEAFDQGGAVREWVKWDYELRMGEQVETVVDRALAITHSEPPGPVYLSLPREVLAERLTDFEYSEPSRVTPVGAQVADPAAVAEAAALLAGARNPIVIAKMAGRDPRSVAPLIALAERLGMPVIEHAAIHVNFPQNHPLHAGFDPAPYLGDADVIVVLESDAPWFPKLKAPSAEARVIQVGLDPLFSRYPIRGFAADVALGGAPRLTLAALVEAVDRAGVSRPLVEERRTRWAAEHSRLRAGWQAAARKVSGDAPIDMAWLSRCIGEVVDDRTIVVNEYDLDPTQVCFTRPGSSFGGSPASALGWGLGAALGVKLAARDQTVICTVGDGAYLFGAPTAAHWASRAHDLPALFVVFNNRAWNAVKRSVTSHAPDGWAARAATMPLSDLDPAPDYEMICRACGGWGEKIEDPKALPDALQRALKVVRDEGRQALLNVICKKP
ncbi:MAG: thiamine pyrophosphate-requiring protein [Candidatus Rokubacteria bacterium]|nr:thiamine pyrophosphate-requiring protein [Candidatus Rokubacteria bacterium]MBI3825089.1 thiamine pyrophosphate-requiring protein [Candidatus Rokubacteria bacterium]